MIRRLALALPVLALTTLFIVTGLRGVDFGHHWDEVEWHVDPVRQMVTTGVLLPRGYIYPSLSKWLGLVPAVPVAVAAAVAAHGEPRAVQAAVKATVDAPDYLLAIRRVFIVMAALAIVWIYGAARALERKPWEAFAAAACVGLSWEYAYHARWVANDCLLTQFAALAIYLLALYYRSRRAGWLYGAAIAVGLGTGAKFPGVTLLLPVLAAGVLLRPGTNWRGHAGRVAALSAVAFAAYLVTTPGTLLDPFKFIEDGRRISSAYQGTHFGYSVSGPAQHWRVAISYLALAFFSPFMGVAAALFACAVIGAVAWVRADRPVAAVLVGFPLLFLAFFCGKYTIAIVRNYLFLAPFLALVAARGLGELEARLRPLWTRRVFAAALVVCMLAQAVWLVRAGESIRSPDPRGDARAALAYVAGHAGTRFTVSPRVRELATAQGLTWPANAVDDPDAAAVVFFARADGPGPRRWTTNDPWLTRAVFGPREVNFDWYASWDGADRIVVMTKDKAREAGVALAR